MYVFFEIPYTLMNRFSYTVSSFNLHPVHVIFLTTRDLFIENYDYLNELIDSIIISWLTTSNWGIN